MTIQRWRTQRTPVGRSRPVAGGPAGRRARPRSSLSVATVCMGVSSTLAEPARHTFVRADTIRMYGWRRQANIVTPWPQPPRQAERVRSDRHRVATTPDRLADAAISISPGAASMRSASAASPPRRLSRVAPSSTTTRARSSSPWRRSTEPCNARSDRVLALPRTDASARRIASSASSVRSCRADPASTEEAVVWIAMSAAVPATPSSPPAGDGCRNHPALDRIHRP